LLKVSYRAAMARREQVRMVAPRFRKTHYARRTAARFAPRCPPYTHHVARVQEKAITH